MPVPPAQATEEAPPGAAASGPAGRAGGASAARDQAGAAAADRAGAASAGPDHSAAGRAPADRSGDASGGAYPAEATAPADRSGADHAGPGDADIVVRQVSKVFPNGTTALTPTDLEVGSGQFVSIVGPSGCGKSTLLRIVAGLTPATTGECTVPTGSRRAFVFQDPTLLPWRTVRANAQLLLELEGFERAERQARAAEALRLVGLEGFERAYPRNLSGGMKMRLSLARALALQPKLFLMDEPFSALDEITREALNDELLRIWSSEGFTALFVTHNLYEAVYLSNRVLVMSPRPGRVVAEIAVPLAYPRTPELRSSPEFTEVTAAVSAALRSGTER